MMIDLEKMPLAELCSLRAQLETEIRRRGSSTQRLLKRVQRLVTEKGLTLQELMRFTGEKSGKNPKAFRTGSVIKYRNPVNASQGWTGHGRKPGWVVDYLANGGSLDELAV